MVIGDFLGYSTYGQGSVYTQKPATQVRPAVTLEAERDPQTPHQYRVLTKPQVIPPPEATTDAKSASKKSNQNSDPVSRAFLAVADYSPTYHRIDVKV
ncbi:MAG: hypothetical protein EOO68_00345 [Moraxellaceae bacterium]|nr:MAG: hypothetical protein EOO68_00345 [Moraxellaceae bacterium]